MLLWDHDLGFLIQRDGGHVLPLQSEPDQVEVSDQRDSPAPAGPYPVALRSNSNQSAWSSFTVAATLSALLRSNACARSADRLQRALRSKTTSANHWNGIRIAPLLDTTKPDQTPQFMHEKSLPPTGARGRMEYQDWARLLGRGTHTGGPFDRTTGWRSW